MVVARLLIPSTGLGCATVGLELCSRACASAGRPRRASLNTGPLEWRLATSFTRSTTGTDRGRRVLASQDDTEHYRVDNVCTIARANYVGKCVRSQAFRGAVERAVMLGGGVDDP